MIYVYLKYHEVINVLLNLLLLRDFKRHVANTLLHVLNIPPYFFSRFGVEQILHAWYVDFSLFHKLE